VKNHWKNVLLWIVTGIVLAAWPTICIVAVFTRSEKAQRVCDPTCSCPCSTRR